MLRCSNQECESRHEGTPMFTLNVTVDEDRHVCQIVKMVLKRGKVTPELRKVGKVETETRFFECVYCHAEADEVIDA